MFRAISQFLCASLTLAPFVLHAGDQSQFGKAWTRNMVSNEKGLPSSFDPKSGSNVRWTAKLGTESYSTPVVAGGRVYIGTNNGEPRDPNHQGDLGVMMCFDEKDGHLLWQLVSPKRAEDIYMDWPKTGMSSTVTVEGNKVYLVNNRGEVLCLDARGMANGNDGTFKDEGRAMSPADQPPLTPGPLDADILWMTSLRDEVGIWPHDAAHTSILIDGDLLYLNTGTGVDNTHRKIRTPDAPSLVVVDKRTGRILARDNEKIAPNIFHCTWSSPTLATVNGRKAVLFAAGNGYLYAFEPLQKLPAKGEMATLKKIWQFDFDPAGAKELVHRFTTNRRESPSNFYGMPVFENGLIYLAGGGDWFWGKNEAWLKAIEPNGTGDLPQSNVKWSYDLGRHTMVTPPVHDGLIYATDSQKFVHCVDAKTGKVVWTHELKGELWSSPLIADGKIFIGTRRGDFWILKEGREKQVLSSVELGQPISATPVAANGRLYVATMTTLYCLDSKPGK